jgi:hypothetical protein
MSWLEGVGEALRDSPAMKAVTATRYGGGNDPYEAAWKNYQELGYPAPGSEGDEGEAQRYNATNLSAGRYGLLPLATNAFHEAVLSHFAEGEKGPSLKRWMAGNRGVMDAFKGRPEDSGKDRRYRRIR